jgi:PadR family transcriptional regulator PadR
MTGIDPRALDRELKRGSAELLILSLLEAQPRHGYDLSKRIGTRSGWVEKPGERRRRFYKVAAEGRGVLAQQRKAWAEFVEAVHRVTGGEHA